MSSYVLQRVNVNIWPTIVGHIIEYVIKELCEAKINVAELKSIYSKSNKLCNVLSYGLRTRLVLLSD